MIKCLKSEVCGTHEQCTVHCWKVKTCGWKKKKRKRGSANTDPNGYLVSTLS